MKKYILVVEASFLGISYISQAIKNLGYEPIFLTNYRSQEGDALIQLAKERAIFCETTEVEDIKQVVNSLGKNNVVGLTTFLDSRLAIIATANKELGLAGVSESVINLKDKSYVNRLIPEYVPQSCSLEWGLTPEIKIKEFISFSAAKKFIAKPSLTAGAIGTFTFNSFEQLKHRIEQALNKIPSYLEPNKYVIQEFFNGKLISIEGYMYKNHIEFIGATKRFKYGNTETKHQFPYQSEMGNDVYEKCKEVIRILIGRSGYDYGFFHIEFMVNGDNVRLIDANMGRPGGANIMELLAFAYGIDLVKLFEHAISIAVLQAPIIKNDFFTETPCLDMTGILYGQKETARLLRFELPNPKSSHHLAVNMGTIVPELGESNWSAIGILTGRPEDVFEDLENIKLITDKGECGAAITK
ncbi:ATP-grasp domain-containing protein [Xenorhabdus taiwanensis]|uniref:ATP-grasp domain-containing protein n=1 Tax=Xenorhabdus taiwanensis TaxID=3085177 RepID=A0ABM8JSR8_9GAMM|nr:hypothetical protein TCT1_06720 [Xenorhabdus sp. TCT-1]